MGLFCAGAPHAAPYLGAIFNRSKRGFFRAFLHSLQRCHSEFREMESHRKMRNTVS